MTHARTTIVDAVVSAVTGLSITGANVFRGRALPITTASALVVYARSESADYENASMAAEVMRVIDLRVVGYLDDRDNLEAALDTVSEEVEKAIYSDSGLGALVQGVELSDTEIEVEAENDGRHGSIDVGFLLYYRAAEGSPDVLIT